MPNNAVYVVDLRGTWERPRTKAFEVAVSGDSLRRYARSGVYDWSDSLYRELVPPGNRVTFTHKRGKAARAHREYHYSGEYTFHTEVKAKNQDEAFKKAERRLRKLMRHTFCRPPTITID